MCDTNYSYNAKHYLNAIRAERQAIERERDMIERLETDAASITAAINPGRVSGTKDPHSGEDKLIAIADASKSIDDRLVKYNDMRAEALHIIMQLEDSRYRLILGNRYLCSMSWDDVADSISYERRQMFRLHGSALIEFGKLLSCH